MDKGFITVIVSQSSFSKRYGFHLIESYINLSFYSLFIPFRINYNKRIQRYEVVKSGFQKLLCVLYHTLYILYVIFCNGHQIFYHKSVEDDPSQYFKFAETIIEIFYACLTMYTVFCKVEYFHEFLEVVQEKQSIVPLKFSEKYFIATLILSIFWVYNAFIQLNETLWLQIEVADGAINFGFNDDVQTAATSPRDSQISGIHAEKPLSPLGYPAQLCLHLFLAYGRAISSTTVFLFFSLGLYLNGMCDEIKRSIADGVKTPSQVLQEFFQVKRVNTLFDSIIGALFWAYIIGSVPYFARFLLKVGENHAYIYVIVRTIHIITHFWISIAGSAAANYNARLLRDELVKQKCRNNDYDKVDPSTFMTLLMELSNTSESVGLHGWKFFTASYQFFGLILSQCLVYALILLQLDLGKSPHCPPQKT